MVIRPEVVNLILDENMQGFNGRRKAAILKKKVNKLAKEGKLTTNFFNTPGKTQAEWAYRIFSANMILGDLSWWGWEGRSKWAWDLANGQWFYPKWNGKPCKLLVVAEQGVGDEILFISCAKEVARENPDLHWEVDRRLISILRRSIPEVNWITRWKTQRESGDNEPWSLTDYRGEYEAFIPAGNVPKLFRTSKQDFPRKPYLFPLEGGTGLEGRSGYVSQAGASMEKQTPHEGLGEVNLHHRIKTGPINAYDDNFERLFTRIASLNEVNAVPSAVVHICGAIGQTCNVIMPPKIIGEANTILKWYYGRQRKMDWYGDHVTIYRSRAEFDSERLRAVQKNQRSSLQGVQVGNSEGRPEVLGA